MPTDKLILSAVAKAAQKAADTGYSVKWYLLDHYTDNEAKAILRRFHQLTRG